MNLRLVVPALCILLLADTPTPAPTPTPISAPSINVPPGVIRAATSILQRAAGDIVAPFSVDPNHVRGTVTFFRRYDMQVQMPFESYANIHLHQGTVINPRGESIENGQHVDVQGTHSPDGSINADVITIL